MRAMDWFRGISLRELVYRLQRPLYQTVYVRVGDKVCVGHYVFGVLVRIGRVVGTMGEPEVRT